MSDRSQPQDKEPVTLGILDRVLKFIDAPWKAVAVLVFALCAGAGWIIYLERARIADAVLHEPITRPVLKVQAFVMGWEKLLRDTRGDVAVLSEVNLNDNVAMDRVGFDRDGTPWVPIQGPQPALYPHTNMERVLEFLRNDLVCADTKDSYSADMQALFEAGYTRACLLAVPPILGVTVGGLVVAWRVALSPAAEERAGISMKAAAMTFATW